MDWDTVNVSLDQEALHQAQVMGDAGFSLPWWAWLVLVLVALAIGFGAVKKAKEGAGDNQAADKKD